MGKGLSGAQTKTPRDAEPVSSRVRMLGGATVDRSDAVIGSEAVQNPIALLLRAAWLWLQGRVHFVRDLESARREDRHEMFHAFRKVTLDPRSERSSRPRASFQVRFRFKNLSAAANRRLSAIPTPLIPWAGDLTSTLELHRLPRGKETCNSS